MKKRYSFLLFITTFAMVAQVGINTTTPDASAMLDISSTDKGILVPRMTQAQRAAITTPATSLLVYQTDAPTGFWFYNGTAWTNLGGSGEFKSIGGLVQNTTNTAGDDFVFGSTSLDNIAGTNDDSRMFFDKSKSAFRAGGVSSLHWDDVNVGNYSIALGNSTIASGTNSLATGYNTRASGWASTAMGNGTASGTLSVAMGNSSIASGSDAIAMGHTTIASGDVSLAMGEQTTASGLHSTAIGYGNTAPSYGETTLGTYATTYTPASVTNIDANDRLFSIGNGTYFTRSNAITILKDGKTGIGTDTPNASALLDLTSANKGILVPRMSQAQRTAIATPATSLLVYQTDATTGFWFYNGTAWVNLNSMSGEFKSIGGLVQNTTNTANDDFVFGSTSLADIAGTNDNSRVFYDKSKGSFRAGQANNASWDDVNVGAVSAAFGADTTASGWASTAMGFNTTASFNGCTAMGQSTIASGNTSTAMGYQTVSSGNTSTTLGAFNTASGTVSTAMGQQTTASGNYSTAMGLLTNASAQAATAMGQQTTASGFASTTSGLSTTASGNSSTAIGDNNTAPSYGETVLGTFATTYTPVSTTVFNATDRIFSVGNGTSATRNNAMTIFKNGNFTVGSDNLNNITGTNDDTRMFFNKSKAAFRAGQATNAQWDDVNVGNYSTALGYNTTASGFQSISIGSSCASLAAASTAMGFETTASGNNSTAMGNNSIASGFVAIAMGREAIAPSYGEIALGLYPTTYTPASATTFDAADRIFSLGNGILGTRSNAMTIFKNGNFTVGSDNLNDITGTSDDNRMFFNKSKGAFRAGQATSTQWDDINVGNYSTGLGYNTKASGSDSFATGSGTIASNSHALATGYQTTASGNTAIAMGYQTTASGDTSTALGSNTTASGINSTAIGVYNTSPSYGELTVGNYATTYTPASATSLISTDRVFSVGNGTSTAARSNAMTILKNGCVGIGTSAPTKALLEINGGVSLLGNFAMVAHTSGSTTLNSFAAGTYGNPLYSIYATNNIAATQFHAYSDERIKKVLGISNSANDLKMLEKIEITNYKMIDTIQQGNKSFKKVIAQQVEKVYPLAVSGNIKEFIPNIYKVSTIQNGTIPLLTDVKKGDKIKLIFEDGEMLANVINVTENSFEVDTNKTGNVFVYGKEVNDFKAVDYEALSTLNISATQELLKRIKELEADKNQLNDKVQSLEKNQTDINTRLDQLEIFLIKNASSTIELTSKNK